MNKIFFVLILIISMNSYAQNNEVRLSMGIDFISTPSLKDYIDQLPYEELGDFNSAVNFSCAYGRMITDNYQIEAELGFLIYSFNSSDVSGNYDFSYTLWMPSVLNYYVISGEGYNLKFGGGVGLRLLSVDEKIPGLPDIDNYSSTGFGLILRAAGNTEIAEDVFAYIASDIRYDLNGEPKNEDQPLYNTVLKENVKLNSLSFGVRLGISYQF